MSKFSRVVRFKKGFHTISHQGMEYAEDEKGTGYFEAKHDHADHFVGAGFVDEYAGNLAEAEEKFAAELNEASKPEVKPEVKPGQPKPKL